MNIAILSRNLLKSVSILLCSLFLICSCEGNFNLPGGSADSDLSESDTDRDEPTNDADQLALDTDISMGDADNDNGDCECSTGPCCDGCNFYVLADNHTCEIVSDFDCSDNTCGADSTQNTGIRLCQGGTSECTGVVNWQGWTVTDFCDSDQICETDSKTYARCTDCEKGCLDGECIICHPDTGWYDESTGYCWENPSSDDHMNYEDAEAHCASLGVGWRMPDIDELRTLIRGCSTTVTGGSCTVSEDPECLSWKCAETGCDMCTGSEGPGTGGCYWSSELTGACDFYMSSSIDTGTVPIGDYRWAVGFRNAAIGSFSGNYRIRCIR